MGYLVSGVTVVFWRNPQQQIPAVFIERDERSAVCFMKSVSISYVLEWFILPFQATAFVLLHNMKRPLGGKSFKINTGFFYSLSS